MHLRKQPGANWRFKRAPGMTRAIEGNYISFIPRIKTEGKDTYPYGMASDLPSQ